MSIECAICERNIEGRLSMDVAKTRYPLAQAQRLAEQVRLLIADSCERVQVAGSIRRRRLDVGDIELVCIPKQIEQRNLLGEVVGHVDMLDLRIKELIGEGILEVRGGYGEQNKMLRHVPSGVPVDVFSTASQPCDCGKINIISTGKVEGNAEESKLTKPEAVQAELRHMPEVLRESESSRMQQDMQRKVAMGRRQGTETRADASNANLQDLREALPRKDVLEGQANLFSGVQEDSSGARPSGASSVEQSEGLVSERRVRDGVSPRSAPNAEGAQGRVRDGASSGDGGALGPEVGAVGKSPSPEWGQARQQNREPRNSDARSPQRMGIVPALSPQFSGALTCPKCQGTGRYAPNWGMGLLVRTGPREFNIRVMARLKALGHQGHAYAGVTLDAYKHSRREVDCPTEQAVFDVLGWEYIEPGKRQ